MDETLEPDQTQGPDWKVRYQQALDDWEQREQLADGVVASLRRAVLRVSLAAEGLDSVLDRQLTVLRETVRGEVDPAELDRQVEAIAQTVLSLERRRTAPPPADAATAGFWQRLFGCPSQSRRRATAGSSRRSGNELPEAVRESLSRLLGRLTLPQELQPVAERLQEAVHGATQLEELPDLLEQIVALVLEANRGETAEIEGFLRQVAERLADIESFLQHSSAERQAVQGNEQRLDHSIRSRVLGMQDSLRRAVDLEQIKERLSVQLDSIVSSMDLFAREQQSLHQRGAQRLQELAERLRQTEQEADALRETLMQQKLRAQLDPLTRLANRQAYNERLEYEHARWQRYSSPLALLVIDIDRFKTINDRFGHSAGDKVLQAVARVLQNNLRSTDFLARYGGEEFVVLMPETPLEAAQRTAEKLREAVEGRPFRAGSERLNVTVSVGVAAFGPGDAPQRVFDRADRALYRAKEAGRNRIRSSETALPHP